MDHHAEREDRKSLGMFREAGGGGVSETDAMAGCRRERMRRRGGRGGSGMLGRESSRRKGKRWRCYLWWSEPADDRGGALSMRSGTSAETGGHRHPPPPSRLFCLVRDASCSNARDGDLSCAPLPSAPCSVQK